MKIRKLRGDESIPYDLLLLADPSLEMIDRYLGASHIYIAEKEDTVVGAYVLFPIDENSAEIKNIAVDTDSQNKGVGKSMLEHADVTARNLGFKTLIIGTGNNSIIQLYLYQKQGFDLTDIKFNFFLDNYKEVIIENDIQCKHMLVLTKELF